MLQHVLCTMVRVFLSPLLILIDYIFKIFGICCENCDNRNYEYVDQLQTNQCQQPYKARNCVAFVLHFLSHFFYIFPTRGFLAPIRESFSYMFFLALFLYCLFVTKQTCQVEEERVISPTNISVHASGVSVKTQVPSKIPEMLDEMTVQQV